MIFKHHKLSTVVDELKKLDVDSPERLTIAVTGDIHLYHPRVPTTRIVKHLKNMFTDELLKQLDVIVLNGDILDRRLSLESDDLTTILDWFGKIMRDCKKYNVRLFVLEGTRSHDHKQASLFEFIDKLSRLNCDLHYFDEVTVAELAPGFNAVFVPDEINYDASITAKEVLTAVQLNGMEKVDFAFIHGMFRYQAPIETPVSHNEEFYEDLVKHRTVINHIHTPSAKGKIRAPGSPVRLRHGEEETKGFYVASVKGDDVREWYVEVENNVVWTTLNVTGQSYSEVCELLDNLSHLEQGANLKLRMSRTCPAKPSIRTIKSDYPHFRFMEDFTDGKQASLGDGDELIVHNSIKLVLTRDVILDEIKTRMEPMVHDKESLELLDALLKEGG